MKGTDEENVFDLITVQAHYVAPTGERFIGFAPVHAFAPSNDINIDFILDERARELAGEYVRWTDLKRTHTLVEYATKYNEDGIKESAMIGPDGKYKILRPITQAAIDLNQAKVTQNPGY